MTIEEAYNRIDAIIAKHEIDDEYVTIINSEDYDALRIARKALEQPPCEDAIGRQAVVDMAGLSDWFDSSDSYNEFVFALSELPPVTPQPKTGHWIEDAGTYYKAIHERGCEPDENTPIFLDDIACPECLAKFSVIDNETERFECCPHCGAKMVEPQEGSEEV